jgi:hypothetical protein
VIDGYLEMVAAERSKSHHDATLRALKVKFKRLHGLSLASIERARVATELATIRKTDGPMP